MLKQKVPKEGKQEVDEALPSGQPRTMSTIHIAHENFNMVFNIMVGIKRAVDSTLDLPLIKATEKDFHLRCQHEIAPYRTESGDSVKACTFFDYAPQIFAQIRKSSGIKKHEYSRSLGPEHILGYMFNANFQTLTEQCSSGKSGSFFYYTIDGRFLLKTIRKDEFKAMKGMLKDYYDYLTEKNPQSMISRIFGLHKIIFYRKKHKMQKKIYFCIMNNIFNTSLQIDYRYDLKGSTVGRKTSYSDNTPKDNTIALKDLDFLAEGKKFVVGRENKDRLMKIIQADADFFAKQEIIDYSLMVGVHELRTQASQFKLNQLQNEGHQSESISQISEDTHTPMAHKGGIEDSVMPFN